MQIKKVWGTFKTIQCIIESECRDYVDASRMYFSKHCVVDGTLYVLTDFGEVYLRTNTGKFVHMCNNVCDIGGVGGDMLVLGAGWLQTITRHSEVCIALPHLTFSLSLAHDYALLMGVRSVLLYNILACAVECVFPRYESHCFYYDPCIQRKSYATCTYVYGKGMLHVHNGARRKLHRLDGHRFKIFNGIFAVSSRRVLVQLKARQ